MNKYVNSTMKMIDLQLFAETQTTELPGLSVEMKTYYDKNLIKEAGPYLVHDQFGQTRNIPKGKGKTIEFRKYAPLAKATLPLTEGVTPRGQNLSVTNIEATVSQYGGYIELTDLLTLTAIDNNIVEASKLLGSQAGRTLDTVTRDILNSGTNVTYCPRIGSGGAEIEVLSRGALDDTCQLTVKVVRKVVAKLRAQNAPTLEGGDYVAIIHPYAAYDLMNDPAWIDMHKYTDATNLYKGEIGKVAGVRFVESTEAKIFAGDDLASNSRTLTVNHSGGYSGAITSVTFDGGTVAADALIGRWINIGGVRAKVTDNTTTTITFDSTNFGTVADNAVIYPGEGGSEGLAVFSTLFLGADAYGKTELEGGGLQTIVKQLGSSGTADPLNQRATVGWKADKVAEILVPQYMVRVESVSSEFSDSTLAN